MVVVVAVASMVAAVVTVVAVVGTVATFVSELRRVLQIFEIENALGLPVHSTHCSAVGRREGKDEKQDKRVRRKKKKVQGNQATRIRGTSCFFQKKKNLPFRAHGVLEKQERGDHPVSETGQATAHSIS